VLGTPIGQQFLLPQMQQMQQATNNAGNSMMGGMNSPTHTTGYQTNEPKVDPIESSEE